MRRLVAVLALRLHHTGYRVVNFVEGLHFTKKPY